MTLKNVLNIIPDDTIIHVFANYDVVDNSNWSYYNNCEVTEIAPRYYNNRVSLSIYIEMQKVMPSELSQVARIRAMYEYIYCIKEENVDFDVNASIEEVYVDMHSFWGDSYYTIDCTGRWYDANGDRVC